MKKTFLSVAFAFAMAVAGLLPNVASAGIAPTFPNATITEYFTAPNGRYNVEVDNSLCCTPSTSWGLFAFGVENNTISGISTTRPGWSSMIVDQASWDAGIDLGPITTGGSRAFTNYFDSSDTVALYWDSSESNNIGLSALIESDDRFFWEALLAASSAVSFLEREGEIFEDIDETDFGGPFFVTAPEPFSMALLGFGLVGLGVLRRRRS